LKEKASPEFASKAVTSSQQGIHENLATCIEKHLKHPWQAPIKQHNTLPFENLKAKWDQNTYDSLILDHGCGTALSTERLASLYPESLVVGIDQSAHRIDKAPNLPENALVLQANTEDMVRLILKAQLPVALQCFFYPNPYPKPKHLQRRWHGHPVFPKIVELCDKIWLRTNWEIYAREMASGLNQLNPYFKAGSKVFEPDEPMTRFEMKYQTSGHKLFEVRVGLG
jgi:tRNA G46 methylase TrmB